MGSLYDTKHSMSINTVEISQNDLDIVTTATTLIEPGKFIVGIDYCKLGIPHSIRQNLSSQYPRHVFPQIAL